MGLNISLQINFTGVLNGPGKELIMNLHNLPNVIGEQRKLLKAIADAEITSDDMLKLSELDPEFGKLSSIVATIYSKVSTTTDISLAEVTPNNEDQTIETTPTQREEWVPATKLRNMYPLAYSFIRNCVDLSASRKEEIWKVFRKAHSEYSISEDDFYRLMRLVINIRVEKAREIDEKVNSSLVAKKSEDNSATESKSLIDKPIIDDEPVDEPKKDKKTTKAVKDLKDPNTDIAIKYPLQYSWLRSQQIDYLKKNTVTRIREDFEKNKPYQKGKCGRTTFGRLIKLVIEGKTEEPNTSKAPAPEPIGQFKEYPKNPGVRFFENGCVQCLTKEGKWTTRKISVAGGYNVITYQGKTISIAKAMLETFKPMTFNDGKQRVPYYKDGNKLNCHIDNLSWDLPATKPTVRQIHEACKIIASNINGSMESWLNIMAEKGEGVQNHALESILKGEYTSISEKYFTLQNGKPVLNQKETKTEEVPTSNEEKPIIIGGSSIEKHPAQSSVEKLIDTINYKKLMEDRRGDVLSYFKATKNIRMAVKAFEAKMELKMTIDSSDKIIPVLEFSLDKEGNLRNAGDVLKDITRKYGNLYITQNYVKDILTGKIGKEYSDLVFK
jgi:hypothetical protein